MQHLLKDSDLNKAQIEALIALGKACLLYTSDAADEHIVV